MNYLPRQSHTDAVAVNDPGGIMAIVRHLYDLGHRHIAFFGVLPGHFPVLQRVAGFRQALAALSLPVEEAYIALPTQPPNSNWVELSTKCAYQAVREWSALPEPPTAVVTMGDTMAFRVLQAARDLGVSVPDELSVTGYDDLELCQFTDPPLTTVGQPSLEVAQTAVKLLLDRMATREQSSRQVLIAPTLVVRGSTQPVAAYR
jgi:LacI family xylobiose transport system transcriptional regulator